MRMLIGVLGLLIAAAMVPLNANICVAVADECGLAVGVNAPVGGWCASYSRGLHATAVAYDSAGNIVESITVRCPPIGPC